MAWLSRAIHLRSHASPRWRFPPHVPIPTTCIRAARPASLADRSASWPSSPSRLRSSAPEASSRVRAPRPPTRRTRCARFGGAPDLGPAAGLDLNTPILDVAAHPNGNGYWIVSSDGGVFTFGDAHFFGSTGGLPLKAPVVGMAAVPGRQRLLARRGRRWGVQLRQRRVLRVAREPAPQLAHPLDHGDAVRQRLLAHRGRRWRVCLRRRASSTVRPRATRRCGRSSPWPRPRRATATTCSPPTVASSHSVTRGSRARPSTRTARRRPGIAASRRRRGLLGRAPERRRAPVRRAGAR